MLRKHCCARSNRKSENDWDTVCRVFFCLVLHASALSVSPKWLQWVKDSSCMSPWSVTQFNSDCRLAGARNSRQTCLQNMSKRIARTNEEAQHHTIATQPFIKLCDAIIRYNLN
jgi:hypothetical protein